MSAPASAPAPDAAARSRLTRAAALASIAAAGVLAMLKTWAVWRTNSTAMLGSLADTALDLFASLAVLAGVWIAARPPDQEHRFGHGKAEALAAMAQVVLIALAAGAILLRALSQLMGPPQPVSAAADGVAVSVAAIAVTLALLAWQRHVIRRTGSLAIRTDALHYQSDLLLNCTVIVALAADAWLGLAGADPLLGAGIALWLARGAWRAGREAIDQLMDREWPDARRAALVAAVARHGEALRLHDLRTRSSGASDFAQFHVDLPASMSVGEAHARIERLEADLAQAFPGVEWLIHVDPAGHRDQPHNPLAEASEFNARKEPDG